MFTIIDFYRCIRQTLETEFVDIPVQVKDLKNPHPPCFYIKLIINNAVQTAQEFETITMSFDIIYFSNDETLLDLLKIQDKLQKLFQYPLKIMPLNSTKITFVEITGANSTIDEDEYVIHFNIDIEYTRTLESNLADRYQYPDNYNGVPSDSDEMMELLDLKNKGE